MHKLREYGRVLKRHHVIRNPKKVAYLNYVFIIKLIGGLCLFSIHLYFLKSCATNGDCNKISFKLITLSYAIS